MDTIINFKQTKQFKEAVRKAAFHAGYKNISEFLNAIVSSNKFVKQQLTTGKK